MLNEAGLHLSLREYSSAPYRSICQAKQKSPHFPIFCQPKVGLLHKQLVQKMHRKERKKKSTIRRLALATENTHQDIQAWRVITELRQRNSGTCKDYCNSFLLFPNKRKQLLLLPRSTAAVTSAVVLRWKQDWRLFPVRKLPTKPYFPSTYLSVFRM